MKKTVLFILLVSAFKFGFAQTQPDTITIKKGLSTSFIKNGKLLKPKEIEQIVTTNSLASDHYQQAKKNILPATIFGSAGGFLIGYPLGSAIAGGKFNFGLLGIGVGLVGVSIPFSSAYNKHTRKAVQVYNGSVIGAIKSSKPKVSSFLGASGLGLKAVF